MRTDHKVLGLSFGKQNKMSRVPVFKMYEIGLGRARLTLGSTGVEIPLTSRIHIFIPVFIPGLCMCVCIYIHIYTCMSSSIHFNSFE